MQWGRKDVILGYVNELVFSVGNWGSVPLGASWSSDATHPKGKGTWNPYSSSLIVSVWWLLLGPSTS